MCGSVLLEAATKQYNTQIWQDAHRARGEIRIPEHQPLPFNETPMATESDGPDHWYELDPKSQTASRYYLPHRKSSAAPGPHGTDSWAHLQYPLSQLYLSHRRLSSASIQVLGSIFTTRMPRALDFQSFGDNGECFWNENGSSVPLDANTLAALRTRTQDGGGLSFPNGITDARQLRQRMQQHKIQLAILLIEDEELERVHSTTLISFYESCGTSETPIEVVRTPFHDFTCPSHCIEHQDIARLCTTLAQGKNCLVHCFGGSGRTGTIVVGALCCIGLFNPTQAIKYAHTVKSTYIETPQQLELVEGEFDERVYNGLSMSEAVQDIALVEASGQRHMATDFLIQVDDATTGLLLEAATKQYNSKVWQEAGRARGPVRAVPFMEPPFNETPAAMAGDGPDHWYTLDLKSQVAQTFYLPMHKLADESIDVLGSIFTTRVPRALDFQSVVDGSKCVWTERFPVNDSLIQAERLKTLEDQSLVHKYGVTHGAKLAAKLRHHRIALIVSLVEDEELERVDSRTLVEFYKSCSSPENPIKVLRTPFTDFTCPSHCLEHDDIIEICTTLAQGKNCLVHCFGGSGRTGTIVVGALCCLGLFDPKRAIKFSHTVKSTYIETPEQLDLVRGEFDELLQDGQSVSEVVGHISALHAAGQDDAATELAVTARSEVVLEHLTI